MSSNTIPRGEHSTPYPGMNKFTTNFYEKTTAHLGVEIVEHLLVLEYYLIR